MNIQNLLNINFSGNIEDKKGTDRRPYLAPQKPDTFERTTAPKTEPKKDTVLNKIAKMYSNVVPMELDHALFLSSFVFPLMLFCRLDQLLYNIFHLFQSNIL